MELVDHALTAAAIYMWHQSTEHELANSSGEHDGDCLSAALKQQGNGQEKELTRRYKDPLSQD